MGKQINGIFGGFSGKVGDVVGSSWRGKSYVKRMPKKSDKPKSERQLAQQAKFAMVVRLLHPVTDLLNIGFRLKHKAATGYNLAVKHHLADAITGIYPDFAIDYSKLLLTKGSWGRPECVELLAEQGSLMFSWFADGYRPFRYGDDEVRIIVYEPETNAYLKGPTGLNRSEGIARVDIPEAFQDKTLHTYLFCVSRCGQLSETVYGGAVNPVVDN